ncbi:hypothetical protein FB451DRAFT_292083 [Mycena latifolia]|nr:hypothetical protein FB451DRAFT_292083 [Mycena latifolia]
MRGRQRRAPVACPPRRHGPQRHAGPRQHWHAVLHHREYRHPEGRQGPPLQPHAFLSVDGRALRAQRGLQVHHAQRDRARSDPARHVYAALLRSAAARPDGGRHRDPRAAHRVDGWWTACRPRARVNMYSTTETQHAVSYFAIPPVSEDPTFLATQKDIMPAGAGMIDVQLLVINRNDRIVPCAVGEVGKIYVRSGGLAEGYLNAAATAEKFVANWFAADAPSRKDTLRPIWASLSYKQPEAPASTNLLSVPSAPAPASAAAPLEYGDDLEKLVPHLQDTYPALPADFGAKALTVFTANSLRGSRPMRS